MKRAFFDLFFLLLLNSIIIICLSYTSDAADDVYCVDSKLVALEVLNNYQRKKLDESNDKEFYSDPKFVYHLDANFRQNLSDLYEREIDNNSTVLDLMSSWDSYLPKGKKYKKVIGHGLNLSLIHISEPTRHA